MLRFYLNLQVYLKTFYLKIDMNVTLPFDELCRMMSDFTQIGFMEAVKAYEPAQDLLRVRDVKKWLKIMLIDENKFESLVHSGVIKAKRMGTGKNSPFYFSKKEIKSALVANKIFSSQWTIKNT